MLGVTPFPRAVNSEEAIVEVLKYSQRDMDAAIDSVLAAVGLTPLSPLQVVHRQASHRRLSRPYAW